MAKWDDENWREAPGITERGKLGTNDTLAERDYSLPCKELMAEPVAKVKGYFIWWCSIHHQPLPWCKLGKSEEELRRIKLEAIDVIRGKV